MWLPWAGVGLYTSPPVVRHSPLLSVRQAHAIAFNPILTARTGCDSWRRGLRSRLDVNTEYVACVYRTACSVHRGASAASAGAAPHPGQRPHAQRTGGVRLLRVECGRGRGSFDSPTQVVRVWRANAQWSNGEVSYHVKPPQSKAYVCGAFTLIVMNPIGSIPDLPSRRAAGVRGLETACLQYLLLSLWMRWRLYRFALLCKVSKKKN